MSMTEKQGGSDVRANTTRAAAAGDGRYRLTGHKWFTSAPRVTPENCRENLWFPRLKDKLGNRSNPLPVPRTRNFAFYAHVWVRSEACSRYALAT